MEVVCTPAAPSLRLVPAVRCVLRLPSNSQTSKDAENRSVHYVHPALIVRLREIGFDMWGQSMCVSVCFA